jgi:hypothetical protein
MLVLKIYYTIQYMENCYCCVNNLLRTLQGIANQASSYSINDGWRNYSEQPASSGFNIGPIFLVVLIALILAMRPKKAKV